MKNFILDHTPHAELLALLAEEAAELGHAALKLHRAITGKIPTPTTEDEAASNVIEEVADVFNCLELLGVLTMENIDVLEDIQTAKLERWVTRIKEAQERDKAATAAVQSD